jgi:PadR family transcriptional regulator, regulatory protein PadR
MESEPLRTGQIDLLLLALLVRGPLHGYAIIEQLRTGSRGVFDLPEGTVYPALYRLERLGLLRSDRKHISGRVRRTYRITRAGVATLSSRKVAWRELVRSVESVLRGGSVAEHA